MKTVTLSNRFYDYELDVKDTVWVIVSYDENKKPTTICD